MMDSRLPGALRGGSRGVGRLEAGRASAGPSGQRSWPGSPGHRDSGNVSGGYRVAAGRVNLVLGADGDEQMLVLIEIKGTDWGAIPADRVMRNLPRHLRSLQAYLDTASKTWKQASGERPRGHFQQVQRPGGHLTGTEDGAICTSADRKGPAGVSHVSVSGERTELCSSQQKT